MLRAEDWDDPVVHAWVRLRHQMLRQVYDAEAATSWAQLSEAERGWLKWAGDQLMDRALEPVEIELLLHLTRHAPSPLIFHDVEPAPAFFRSEGSGLD